MSCYEYSPLKHPKKFRLLKVCYGTPALRSYNPKKAELELVHARIDQAPPYEAISYVWGNPNKTHTACLALGKTLAITETLDQLLPHLRAASTTGYLWIDQICINQQDRSEVSQQVGMMADIYKGALKTLVWLGNANDVSNLLISTLDTISSRENKFVFREDPYNESWEDESRLVSYLESTFVRPCSTHSVPQMDDDETYSIGSEEQDMDFCHACVLQAASNRRRAACAFMNRPWFCRCWIVQEVLLSKEVKMMIGSQAIAPNDLLRILYASLFTSLEEDLGFVDIWAETSGMRPFCFMMAFWDYLERGNFSTFGAILDDIRCYRVRGYLKATDKRDMIYSLIGLHPNGRALITPDYSLSVEDVYTDTTRSIIEEHRNLKVLGICEQFYDQEPTLALPSWVPDWSREISCRPLCSPSRDNDHFGASGDSEHQVQPRILSRKLVVAGVCVDKITFTHPYKHFQHGLPENRLQGTDAKVSSVDTTVPTAPAVNEETKERLAHLLNGLEFEGLPINTTDKDYNTQERSKILEQYAAGRSICYGTSERVGLSPLPTVTGDMIWVIRGCPVPIVLRQLLEGEYQLVGACCLEGFMKGEVCEKIQAEVCTICLV
ncbi:uncharacterized protein K452DRAFT_307745 [Aplosporella prunicola CBS 121167]|uniref:Heterokaryon incompatibility domain-containing protein n=1 Tax=Aplosporella prunicola CBS 121167 TaxID=1176127 RepID=A0A6A6BF81_9PEZI|nr:uncharacterized protein K452DRAFT_307745 [Aplosporella prunicola CBS 121167]KAF2142832.1 hypothetical protein K452DRAFT_307745 [Aplosporella prunicola CBS 121167]